MAVKHTKKLFVKALNKKFGKDFDLAGQKTAYLRLGPEQNARKREFMEAAKKLEGEFAKRDQELQRMAKQLQGLQENLEKNAVTMAESERRSKEKEFGDLSREFQRKQREFREDLNLRQNEENAAVIEKANRAIKQIAEADKFDLILQDVVWVSPRLDITERVIKALAEGK